MCAEKKLQEVLDDAASNLRRNKSVLADLEKSYQTYEKILKDLGLDENKVKTILDKVPEEQVLDIKEQVKKEFDIYMHPPKAEREKHQISGHSKAVRHDQKI